MGGSGGRAGGRTVAWLGCPHQQDSALAPLPATVVMLTIANISCAFMYTNAFGPHTSLQSGYSSTPSVKIRTLRPRDVGGARIKTRESGIIHLLPKTVWVPGRRAEHSEERAGFGPQFPHL